jgi:multiple sugar transport system permease protein
VEISKEMGPLLGLRVKKMKNLSNRKTIPGNIMSIILLLIGLFSMMPFVFMLSTSFKPLSQVFEYPVHLIPRIFTFDNYIQVFSSDYMFVRWYTNTIIMEIVMIVFKIVITGITAYAFARLKFRWRDKIFLILLASMMVPGEVTLLPRYIVYKFLGITDTMWAMILPYTFEVFLVFLVRQFFMTIPFELTESAIIDGCNHLQVFYRIIAPLAKPAIVTMLLFTFVWSWNDFTTPFIFITDPKHQMLTVGIQYFQINEVADYAMQMAGASLILIPVIIIFLFAQKSFIEGIATSGIKG